MKTKEIAGNLMAQDLTFGIVISRFNDLFTQQLLRGALDCFQRHGTKDEAVTVVPTGYVVLIVPALVLTARLPPGAPPLTAMPVVR